MSPTSWASLPPPTPFHPSRLSQSPRLSFLRHTANSHLLSSLLMLKLKLQYFSHLMWRASSLEKTLMLGMIEGRRRKGRGRDSWMASPSQWKWVWASSRRWRTEKPGMRSQRVGHNWAIEQQCSLHKIVYMFPCYSLHSSHPLLPHPVSTISLFSCLCFHCCHANRFISIIFLDIYGICFTLSDLLYSLYSRL